jgi:uncharacterized metal-binding protein
MPSGKTHDTITWWSTPLVTLLGWGLTHDLTATLVLGASFAFSGLMFSGDLDLKSVQYKRWGWFRWIWIPYQKMVPHRSPLSHGPVLGLATRLVYLSAWLMILFFVLWQGAVYLEQEALIHQSRTGLQQALTLLRHFPGIALALLLGLWLGGLSHTLADEIGSRLKRWKRKRKKPRKKGKGLRKSGKKSKR